jgi:hypothetical protein
VQAKVLRRSDGSVFINSFAHGGTIYELRSDARSVRAAMERADAKDIVRTFVSLAVLADLDNDENEELKNLAAARAKVGKRVVGKMLQEAWKNRDEQRAKSQHDERLAQRRDPRPAIGIPAPDAPYTREMEVFNDVLGRSPAVEPPLRDMDGNVTQSRKRRIPTLHLFTSQHANSESLDAKDTSRLPAPEQWILTRLNEMELAELIERHIDFVDKDGRSVHPLMQFVRHYLRRHDNVLPVVAAIATLPIVLADGTLLAKHEGIDRERAITFHIPEELLAVMPRREECAPEAVAEAMRFLTDDWLIDVLTDRVGKCTLIAAALTIIERSLLPDRPVFFVTAGRRGGGKTTTLIMLIMAIAGLRPAAAAWSTNEEERRKALLSYFLDGQSYLIWDNIPRGTSISCPHVERSCTSAFYIDRRLGVSEAVATAASTIHLFTDNNIGPRGDLASRSLHIRLDVKRSDPENREFAHPDPVAWTEARRDRILRALYTILLGNPMLKEPRDAASKTRFKAWWRLIGSAVEHADQQTCPPASPAGPEPLDFQKLFLEQEDDEEESATLVDTLEILAKRWPEGKAFKASDVAMMINEFYDTDGRALREILFPEVKHVPTAKSVGRRLKSHVDEPVRHGGRTLILHDQRDPSGGPKGALNYYVEVIVE